VPKLLPPPTDPILAELHAERHRRGLTLQQLGEMLGRHTYQSVWQWERGIVDLRLSNLREWAAALGYDVTLTPREAVDRG
jgi:transcriptional regulator with XRE-family HTH domain